MRADASAAERGDDLPDGRPTAAFVLSLIGGILILIDGIATTIVRAIYFTGPRDLLAVFAAIGYAQSMVVLASAILLLWMPNRHGFLGGMIVAFSLFSLLVGAGFILGLILGLTGGLLAIYWRPTPLTASTSISAAQPYSQSPTQPQNGSPSQPPAQPPLP